MVIHKQTVSLYHNSPVCLDTQYASSWDWNPPIFAFELVSYRSAVKSTYVNSGIIRSYVIAFACLYFALLDTRVPN